MSTGQVEGVVVSIQQMRKKGHFLAEVAYGINSTCCQVVVARSDIAVGMRALLALEGAELEGGRMVKKKKVAGEWTEGELLELHPAMVAECSISDGEPSFERLNGADSSDQNAGSATAFGPISVDAATTPVDLDGCDRQPDEVAAIDDKSMPESTCLDLRVSFCPDPKSNGREFTPTYDEDPSQNFASVNAGDPNFKILPGKTLNGQFGIDLQSTAYHAMECYQPFHERLFSDTESGRLMRASSEVVLLNPNLAAGFVRKLRDEDRTGVAFIEVFRSEMCVHGNPKNVAMIYTVGPRRKRCASDQAFLAEVEATAENIGRACAEYNLVAASEAGLPQIMVLRIPMISGGVFAGNCPRSNIATAIVRGLVASYCDASPELNFVYSSELRRAWEGIKKQKG